MHDFKSLRVWNLSMELAVEVYKQTQAFPTEERYGLTQQIRRSAVSIPSNIAEGAYRNSNKEFHHFLGISNGSGGELYTQLLIAKRLGYGDSEQLLLLADQAEVICKMNSKLQLSFK
jgi:four helix bundle protein